MFRKLLDEGQAGDNVGLLLRGIKREDVERGQVVVQARHRSRRTPSSRASVYILSKDEGGRHTPFFNNYRPQFYFRTTDVTGVVTLPEGTEMVMPGDNTDMSVELIQPDRHGRGPALRHPRGRPYRLAPAGSPRSVSRLGLRDHQVTLSSSQSGAHPSGGRRFRLLPFAQTNKRAQRVRADHAISSISADMLL